GQGGNRLDSVFISNPEAGKTIGRYPNGMGAFTYMMPTPEACNLFGTTPETGMLIYPNPARDKVYIEFRNMNQAVTLEIFNISGKLVSTKHISSGAAMIPALSVETDITGLASGIWYIRATGNDKVITKAFAIY
ncbi:MAG: T9SS type A sorting domain-containing protein, partial [Bacteroidota bacterium]